MPRCRRCECQFCLLLTDWPYHRLGGARCTPLVLTTSGSAVRTKVRISFSAPLSTRVLVASISLSPAFSFSTSTHKSVWVHLAEIQLLDNLIITVATWLTLNNFHTIFHSRFIVAVKTIVISFLLTASSVICIYFGVVVPTAATATTAATPSVITPAIKQIYRQTRFHYAVLLSSAIIVLFCWFSFRPDVPSFHTSLAQCVYDARTVHASGTRDPARYQEKEIGWLSRWQNEKHIRAQFQRIQQLTTTGCIKDIRIDVVFFLKFMPFDPFFPPLMLFFFCFFCVLPSFRFHSFLSFFVLLELIILFSSSS